MSKANTGALARLWDEPLPFLPDKIAFKVNTDTKALVSVNIPRTVFNDLQHPVYDTISSFSSRINDISTLGLGDGLGEV